MWFWYALLAAAFSGVSVVLNKKVLHNVSAALVSWTLFILPIPFLFILVLREGVPQVSVVFWVGAAISSAIFAASKTVSLHSIKNSFLSKLYPLISFGTFFQYLFALVFLGEQIRTIPLVGLFMIMFGTYILNVDRAKEHFLMPFKLLITHKESFIFILATVFTHLTGIVDKIAIKNTNPNNALFVLFIEDIILASLLTIYLLKQEKNWFHDLKKNFWLLTLGSMIYTILSLFFLMGITTGAVALVGGIKKIEILFVLGLSYLFFGDKPERHTWIGAMIMLFGVILIKTT